MSLPLPDWRDPAPYAALIAHGRSGLAWEILRRDGAYRAFMARRPMAGVRQGRVVDADPEAARRWGIHFRGTSGSPGR